MDVIVKISPREYYALVKDAVATVRWRYPVPTVGQTISVAYRPYEQPLRAVITAVDGQHVTLELPT